jgi:RIO kinase 1
LKEEEMYRIFEEKIDAFKIKDKNMEDRKTYDEVFDRNTLLVLYKMLSAGVFETLDYPISTGKEGNVFRASGKKGELYAVKIYRTSTSTYKHLTKYITGDPRFRNVPKDRWGIIYLWAQKEYKNLLRMTNAGVASPRPKKQLKNVLVMGYIGSKERSAPMLKDVPLKRPKKSFESIKKMIKKLYLQAKLVHGDLSEYNILVDKGDLFFIDVGQAVVLDHPLAQELLERDIKNITRYFNKLGVDCEEKEMLGYVMGR